MQLQDDAPTRHPKTRRRSRLGVSLAASTALALSAALAACAPRATPAREPESAAAPPLGAVAEAPRGAPATEPGAREASRGRAPSTPPRTAASGGAPASSPRSVPELLDAAHGGVLGLGRADISNIKDRAARVLSALAELVLALDRDGEAAAERHELLFQAERLRRSGDASFAQAGWVRLGLVAALDALERLRPGSTPAPLGEAARRAAEGIPERSSLAFHHAAIQDAARATVDAYLLAALPGARCPSEARPRGRVSRSVNGEP